MVSPPTGPSTFGTVSSGRPLGGGMQSQPFGPDDTPPIKAGSGWGGCVSVLVGIMLVSFVVCGGVNFYGFIYLPEYFRAKIHGLLDESPMPDVDKQIAREQVDRVIGEYKAGRINISRVLVVLSELKASPLFSLATIVHAEQQYIQPSRLTAEEKAEAKLTLQRLTYGVSEQYIIEPELQPLLDFITSEQGGRRVPKEMVTEEELRLFLAECKLTADDANIPEEPFEVNIGEAFKKTVDEALRRSGGEKE